jgi:hypothetical protein
MRRLFALVSGSALLPLASWSSDFDWLVREFAHESGTQPVHIPLFGLVQFAVSVVQPAGTSELRLAVFEHARFDPTRFRDMSDRAVGGSWKPMIRVRSQSGESTNIYAQTERERLRLLIARLNKDDATFIQVRVKPQELMRFVDEHGWRKQASQGNR